MSEGTDRRTLLLGLLVFYRKRRVEQASMDPDRKRSAA